MDIDQRKYLIERIKQEYNSVIGPFKTNCKKRQPIERYTKQEMVDMIRGGDFSKVTEYHLNSTWGLCGLLVGFQDKPSTTPAVDYTVLLEKLATEKNKVLDTIMLGDIPNASEILSNFIKFLNNEKEKLNGN